MHIIKWENKYEKLKIQGFLQHLWSWLLTGSGPALQNLNQTLQ